MADCVSPILEVVSRICVCTANRAQIIRDLQDNLNTLRDLKHDLEAISKDVEQRADFAEQQQYVARTNQVIRWHESVQVKLPELDAIFQKGDEVIQQKCLGSCPRYCRSSYKLGKRVSKEIVVVTKLIEKGSSLVVVDTVPRSMIDEMPMEKTVGMDSMFDEVWNCVEDNSAGIIGLYGMGGVGKTTLLKKINNMFLETCHNFDVVIWVVVSKDMKLDKIQETILNRIDIPKEMWIDKSEEERAVQILDRLRNKRFVLLLDDLWEWLDLSKVGVSFSNNQNWFKIVFTTRSGEVCGQMGANARFKLNGLTYEAALDLFRQKVGEDVLNSHHELPNLAEIVVQECAGLPLALVTIGRAMASRTKPEDWRYAINLLKTYPSRFPEMGKYVFPTLKFSYDSLSDDTLRNCFLYCSIFPEYHNISNRELIELWIAEGFLDDFDDIYEAQKRGRFIINSLKLACLLEGSYGDHGYEKDHVKMHDVFRDMAHWLTREHGNEILVKKNIDSIKSQGIARWKEAVRVTLHGDSTKFLIEAPVSPRLQTLFVMSSSLTTLPGTLFPSIHTLTVLNLLNSRHLKELPAEIGSLISLYYLNLSNTCLSKLPIEVKNLTQLGILLLDGVETLEVIPPGVISSLSSLEMYSCFGIDCECNFDMKLMIEELECLEKITDVGLIFSSVSLIQKFISSSVKLQSCIKRLSIFDCKELCSLDIPRLIMSRMEHLEELYIRYCKNFREVKICFEFGMRRSETNCFLNLQILNICYCGIENLTWLIYIPRLRFLDVSDCSSLEEIIVWDFAGSSEIEEAVKIFSNLEKVRLSNLPKLKSISRRAMPFPSLKDISVYRCQSLRKLPLNAESAKSAKSLKRIYGSRDWWKNLEWEDEATVLAFTSKFSTWG